ncbi:MAG: hypothetical protein AB7U83_10210 [Vicinamibacterales bacterium]
MDRSKAGRIAAAALVVLALAGGTMLAQGANVSGDWSFTVQTDQGSGSPTVSLKQDGESITGTYNGLFGSAPVKGTVKGSAVEFSFTADAQGQQVDSVYKGTVDGDAMKGTVAIAGGQLNGTFTASRKK